MIFYSYKVELTFRSYFKLLWWTWKALHHSIVSLLQRERMTLSRCVQMVSCFCQSGHIHVLEPQRFRLTSCSELTCPSFPACWQGQLRPLEDTSEENLGWASDSVLRESLGRCSGDPTPVSGRPLCRAAQFCHQCRWQSFAHRPACRIH